jgi:hypothetical protein
MKGLILITPLIAGVSVSAHSALLRGGSGYPPRRLKSGSTCASSDDCNRNGDCTSIDPTTLEGTCSCDERYIGGSCDTYIDVSVKSLFVKTDSRVRNLEHFWDAVQQTVDDMEDMSDSEFDDLETVVSVDATIGLAGVTDETSTAELTRVIEDLANIDVTRRLKKSGSTSTETMNVAVATVIPEDRSLDDDRCESETEKACEKVENKWKLKKIEKLGGTIAPTWSCDAKDIEKAWKDAM